jgi:hypothetical protein
MSADLLEKIVFDVIRQKNVELLTTIHKIYPTVFTKANLDKEIKIVQNICMNQYEMMPFNTKKSRENTITVKRRESATASEPASESIVSSVANSNADNVNDTENKPKSKANDKNRCTARAYGKIKIEAKTGNIIEMGRQCKFNAEIDNRCQKHYKNLTHGYYNVPPDEKLIEHFKHKKSNIEYC